MFWTDLVLYFLNKIDYIILIYSSMLSKEHFDFNRNGNIEFIEFLTFLAMSQTQNDEYIENFINITNLPITLNQIKDARSIISSIIFCMFVIDSYTVARPHIIKLLRFLNINIDLPEGFDKPLVIIIKDNIQRKMLLLTQQKRISRKKK
jgi:hypothetical protein